MSGIGDIIWFFLLLSAVQPIIARRMLDAARVRLLQKIERKFNVRVITLIHRQETMSLLGFPLMRYIDINDSEAIIRAIRLTDNSTPIDIVLHTPGGLVLAAVQIARALKKHPARTRVIIPHFAMSGGTLIALAADEILMDENAVLGPVDPQLDRFPAASILKVVEEKDVNDVDDETLIRADLARKAISQLKDILIELLSEKELTRAQRKDVAIKLSSGIWTHDYPITADAILNMGLQISTEMPDEYYRLMNLYPQPVKHSPSVQFVPERTTKEIMQSKNKKHK